MKFIADLHLHSHFSRATSPNLDLEHIYISAQCKGITVVATGDITHPGWFKEITEKLEPAEEGLYRLRKDIAGQCDEKVPNLCRGDVRFILNSEISNIYKKNGKVRKNHNLLFFSSLSKAAVFNQKLSCMGNIVSDGRPILGIDIKNIFEILLETDSQAFLIPAHIWTPWFSLLGSKSGFDSLQECFDDLSDQIFAVETGLSSDPKMNWRVSFLDGLTLISNSDAHSPDKLGREANIFDTDLSFTGIKNAIRFRNYRKFLGTIEFYPEEGKYFFDGHRNCQVHLSPDISLQLNGNCPVCRKPLTLGVLNRVENLSDRKINEIPEKTFSYYSRIPLMHILSEILKVGTGSKKVYQNYIKILNVLGPERVVLDTMNLADIHNAEIPMLGEAIKRMRNGNIHIRPGYDGEFGKIKIFEETEFKQF
jgi:DNA helicase II / ATP-dependent DNA helicase PcrA